MRRSFAGIITLVLVFVLLLGGCGNAVQPMSSSIGSVDSSSTSSESGGEILLK